MICSFGMSGLDSHILSSRRCGVKNTESRAWMNQSDFFGTFVWQETLLVLKNMLFHHSAKEVKCCTLMFLNRQDLTIQVLTVYPGVVNHPIPSQHRGFVVISGLPVGQKQPQLYDCDHNFTKSPWACEVPSLGFGQFFGETYPAKTQFIG